MLEHSCKNDVDPTGGIIAPEKFSETGILSEAPLALHTQKNHLHIVPYPPTLKPTQSLLLFSLPLSLSSLFHYFAPFGAATQYLFNSLNQHLPLKHTF